MGTIHKGGLCRIKGGVEVKDKTAAFVARKRFYCFLVLEEPSKGKVFVTGIYENNRQNYCIPVMLEGRRIWIDCASFIKLDVGCLEPMDSHLEDDVISHVNAEHPHMLKKRAARGHKLKRRMELQKEEEKAWKLMQQGIKGKNRNKKYPYGSGLARREAPSARGITVVQGGRCSPR